MKKLTLTLLFFLSISAFFGQNNITVSVMVNPPYSHDIRDYVNQPGKILVLLMASPSSDLAAGRDVYQFKLIGSITGDNGISLRTKPAYRPPMPIELVPGQSMQLTANDIELYFSPDNLDIQGISKEDLLAGKGLREGTYTICMQAVDYETNEPLSEDEPFGCCAPFDLRYIEPPQLMSPMCQDEMEVSSPQFVNFQWTMPVGVTNPAMLRYKFRLFELPDKETNPESLVNSAMPPFFEQTDIPTTTLIYNMAMPVLDVEKYYAWQVIAEDLNEKIQFANNGKSEICTFSFVKTDEIADTLENSSEEIVITRPASCSPDSVLKVSNITPLYISWEFSSLNPVKDLNFKYPKHNTGNTALEQIMKQYKNAGFKLTFYSTKQANNKIYSSITKSSYFQLSQSEPNFPFINGQSYWFQVSLIDSLSNKEYLKSELCSFKYKHVIEQQQEYVSKTIHGNLKYSFEGDASKMYPMVNVNLRLVKKFVLRDASSGEEIEVPESAYNQQTGPVTFHYSSPYTQNYSFEGLCSTTTDQYGNFTFTLNWPKDEKLGMIESLFSYSANGKNYSGTLSRVIRIEPQNNYYAPVNLNIVPIQDVTSLGSLTTYVYSYSLAAEIMEGYQGVSNLSKPLVNKNVYLIRKYKSTAVPYFEGDIKAFNQAQMVPAQIQNAGYKLIAKQKTELSKDADNKDVAVVNFSNLLQNLLSSHDYFLWIEGTNIQTAQRVHYNKSELPDNSNQGITGEAMYSGMASTVTATSYSEIKDFSFTVKDRFTAISSQPPKSVVKGKLIYSYPGKATTIRPLANTNISIIACYVTGPDGNSKIVKKVNKYEEADDAFYGAHVLGTSTTNANGEFEFEFTNIPAQTSYNNIEEFEVSTGQLNSTQTWEAWEGNKETDFRIKYQKKTGSIRRVFRIVVEDANELYMSPEDNFMIEPLKAKDVGTLTSSVFTYKLNGTIYHRYYEVGGTFTDEYGQQKSWFNFDEHNIPGVECYLLRKKSEIQGLNLPEGEGENILGSLDEYPDYKVVSSDTTDVNGLFDFDNVLFRNTNVPIYFYFRTPKMKGTENYEPLFTSQATINPFTKPRFFFNSDYNYTTITGAGAELMPGKPAVRGKVISNVNAQVGVKFAKCNLYVTLETGIKHFECVTDMDGYFDLTSKLQEINDISKIQEIILAVSKDGFYYNQNGQHKANWVKVYDKAFVQEGRQIVEDNIILSANGGLKGIVKNEKGEAIDAYVRFDENRLLGGYVGEGTLTPTYSFFKGTFNIPAIPGNSRKLIIIPKDVAYFEDTILVNVKEGDPTLVENIVVKERSHRIYFFVKKTVGDGPMVQVTNFPGARVKLLGDNNTLVAIADYFGRVEMNFKNVSVNNLSLQVSGPPGSNYVPKIVSFKNEESKTPVRLDNVTLRPGISLKGIVKLDGQPTSKALVYVDLSKGTDTQLTISDDGTTESQYFYQTVPKSDGSFDLNCLPPELKGKKITIKAVYKHNSTNIGSNLINTGSGTNSNNSNDNTANNANNNFNLTISNNNIISNIEQVPTVIGDSKDYTVQTSIGALVLNLKSYDKMKINDIWGFPLEITDLQEISPSKVRVSGRVKLQGYAKGFDPLGSMNFEIFSVPFVASSQMVGNVPKAEPETNKVIVSAKREAKMKYANSFNVKLYTKPTEGLFVIEKDNNKGVLKGFVEIVDNSFQYPSSYLNFEGTQFYFSRYNESTTGTAQGNVNNLTQINAGNQANLLSAVVDIFNSSQPGNGNDSRKFGLCNVANKNSAIGSNLHFKFINFYTTANASKSFIDGNIITLDATLNANIQNAGQVSINIGNLILKNNVIDPVSGTQPILISLKDGASVYSADAKLWQIEAFDWKVDPQQGGLVSKNCMLHTGKIDLPIKEFNLRSDFAYVGDIQLQGINLGGYPIVVTASESTFGYNQHTGSDQKGHWQLIIFPNSSGQAPGKVYGLPHLSGVLELETISLLSNGEDVFGIGPGASGMKLYNTVNFKPLLLNTIPDGFVLSGGVDFAIPNVQQNLGTRLTFSKNQGVKKLFVDPIDISFEGLGNVEFKPNLSRVGDETKQAFNESQQKFTAYGTVEEAGLLDPVQVFLTYDAKTKKTTIINSPQAPNQTIKIGEENTYLSNITCAMNADATKWNNLTFAGDLDGFGENGMASNKRRLNFTVFGEIKASNQSITANSISTPFGGLEITYEKGRLLGSLSMNNFPLGPALVTGTANMLMDKDGWVFYSSAMAKNVPAPEPTTVNAGILIGNYPAVTNEMKNTVLTYAINKQMPNTFTQNGLKGFYLIGGRDLPIKGLDINIDVVVAKAYVEVPMAGVDASFYMNFANNQKTFGGRLDGGLQILFGLGSITCTSLSGSASATIGIGGEFENNSIMVSGKSEFSTSLTVSQGIPTVVSGCIDAVDISVGVSGGFEFSSKPYNVKFYLK